jgi:hypothetical protein
MSGGTHSFTVPVTRDMLRLTPARDPIGARVYERCAIIGSSGIINQYEFGTEIDNASMVVRFNLAPTERYTAQVGAKTTLRFVNTVHAGYHERDEIGVMQMQSQVVTDTHTHAQAYTHTRVVFMGRHVPFMGSMYSDQIGVMQMQSQVVTHTDTHTHA